MGGVASIFSPPKRPKSPTAAQNLGEARKIAVAKEDEKKKSIAMKLAQIATGAKGILSEANTSRKKLLGN